MNTKTSRREFLQRAAVLAGSAPLAPGLLGAVRAATEPPSPPIATPPLEGSQSKGYQCFSPDEAAFVEALVDLMCPADNLTPGGVECGLAVFIDRQLAGAFGKGERLYRRGPWQQGKPQQGYQLPLTPEVFFKLGLAAADRACTGKYGKGFADLPPAEGNDFLNLLGEGKITDSHLPLADWFNDLLYPLFVQACYADPMYGGNKDKVFWKMVGYPGLPAVYGLDMVTFRGKPHPGLADPKSIADFS